MIDAGEDIPLDSGDLRGVRDSFTFFGNGDDDLENGDESSRTRSKLSSLVMVDK